MPKYRVTNTIVSGNIDGGEPCEVQWYTGDNLALAMSAMTQGATHGIDADETGLPESMRFRVTDVHLHIDHDAMSQADEVAVLMGEANPCDTCECHETDWSYGTAVRTGTCRPGCYCTEPDGTPGATASTGMVPLPNGDIDAPTRVLWDERGLYGLSDCVWWDTDQPQDWARQTNCSGRMANMVWKGIHAVICEAHFNAYPGER